MAIPDFESMMLPLLSYVYDGKEHSMSEIEYHLITNFKLSDDEQRKLKPSSTTETLFQNRMEVGTTLSKKGKSTG